MKYKNNKKAISPLIATVLVIGFTIVLAGVVMQFLIPLFTESTQKSKADAALMNVCGQFATTLTVKDAKFVGIATAPKSLNFTIDNSGNGAVRNFLVKYYTASNQPGSCILTNGATDFLKAGGVVRVNLPNTAWGCSPLTAGVGTTADPVTKLEVIPQVYSDVTKLNSTCTGVVLTATVY